VNGEAGELVPSPRVGDEDRAQVVELLRRHTTDGRLTLDEFSERVGRTLQAQSRGELDQVLSDLPSDEAPGAPERAPRRATRWVVAVMSGAARKGRWRTGERVNAVAFMGGCELDFRQAIIEAPEVVVTAVAFMGGIEVTVPEGHEVELSGVPFMGGKNIKVADVPIIPGSPRIVVRAFPFMGGVNVRSKPDPLPQEARARRREDRRARRASAFDPPPVPPMPRMPGPRRALPPHQRDELADRLQREINERIERAMKTAERHVQRHADRIQRQWGRWDERWGIPVDEVEEETLPSEQDLESVPTAPDGTVTIMFSDICGYTQMTEALGDLVTRDVVRAYQQVVRGQLAAYGGYEVKTQGDGFMVAFAGASRALRCAMAIQRAFSDYNREHEERPIRVHQGLHTGETVRDGDDFLGRTVIIASRICGEAKENEVVVSSLLKELADGTGEFRFGDAREAELKGLSAAQTLYSVLWQ
jgi:class 3 adenylate cyclase